MKKVSRKVLRQCCLEAVYFSVHEDRRLLGIPTEARDQIVTWAVNEAMEYDRVIIDPSSRTKFRQNEDVVLDAMEKAVTAGKAAIQTRQNLV